MQNLTSLLTKWARDFPAKTHLYSIGQSVQGRELWVLALANSQPDVHVIGRPEAKYIGNMHGWLSLSSSRTSFCCCCCC